MTYNHNSIKRYKNNLFVKITGIVVAIIALISLMFTAINDPEILRDKQVQTEIIESITEIKNDMTHILEEMKDETTNLEISNE